MVESAVYLSKFNQIVGAIFRAVFYQPVFNVIVLFYRLFGNNLGLAIISVAALSRIITYPMTKAQIKSAEKSKECQSKYDALKKKYGKNKEKLNEELMKLQGQYLPGQLGGCLPTIILLIFLIQVRNVIRALVDQGGAAFNEVAYSFLSKFPDDAVINLDFLGMDLSKTATDFSWTDSAIIPYVILAIAVGATQFLSSRILTGIRGADKAGKKNDKKKDEKNKKKKEDEDMPDMSSMMGMASKQMMFLFPVITIVTSLGYWGGSKFFPSGISLFWTVQNLFVIIQHMLMNKEDTLKWFNSTFKKKK